MWGNHQRYSYQMTSGNPRIWVIDGATLIGWLDPQTKEIVRFATKAETDVMLADALKRKPPA